MNPETELRHDPQSVGGAAADAPDARRLARLTDVSRAVTYATTLDDVLHIATERAAELLSASKAVLMLVESDGLLHVRSAIGIARELVDRFAEPMDETLSRRLQGLFGASDPEGFVAVPLVVRGRVTGLLAVAREAGAAGTEADEWMLSAVADQTAAPIEVARLDQELRRGLRNARERALATLAHDIRSPLQAIEGYAQLVEEEIVGPLTAEQRGAVQRIRMSGRHLLALQESLLELSQRRADAPSPAQPVRIAEPVGEAVSILRADADAKEHTIEQEVPDDLWALAEPDKLRRVLINLISNAIKYTPAGGRIAIRATRDVSRVAIAIADTGAGIAPDRLEMIFDPYVRGDPTDTTPGLGLGLTICRELVEQLGGGIEVQSARGAGSTFTVTLPAAPTPAE